MGIRIKCTRTATRTENAGCKPRGGGQIGHAGDIVCRGIFVIRCTLAHDVHP